MFVMMTLNWFIKGQKTGKPAGGKDPRPFYSALVVANWKGKILARTNLTTSRNLPWNCQVQYENEHIPFADVGNVLGDPVCPMFIIANTCQTRPSDADSTSTFHVADKCSNLRESLDCELSGDLTENLKTLILHRARKPSGIVKFRKVTLSNGDVWRKKLKSRTTGHKPTDPQDLNLPKYSDVKALDCGFGDGTSVVATITG